jgi:lysophospholipase L1-like esterase
VRWTPRSLLLAAVTVVIGLLLAEVGARIVFSVIAGRSLLLYGFGPEEPEQKPGMLFPSRFDRADWHLVLTADDREKAYVTHETGSYSRYRPHQWKRNRDEYGHVSEIRINNLGVRGPDVTREKPPGTYRILTLGASSTFGYRNRDDETYPRLLERRLHDTLARRRTRDAAACPRVDRFEVINFGIPHLNASHIRAFYLAEGLALDPDFVTFYEGANETRLLQPSYTQRALSALGRRSLAIRFVHTSLQGVLASFSAEDLAEHRRGRLAAFLANLTTLAEASEAADVDFAVVTQSAKSFLVPRDGLGDLSYAEEVARVEAALARDGSIPFKQLVFLMHAELMAGLREWARAENVPLIDVIHAMDRERARGELLSWVHLSAAGNRLVARELADPILDRACDALP